MYLLAFLLIISLPQLFTITAALDASAPLEERKVGRQYPTEIVSKRMLESKVENGEVITFYEYTVRTSRETIIKMINEDWETYEYIKYFRGKSAADEWRRQQIETVTNGPEYVESKIKVVKHGEKCITYDVVLYSRIWPEKVISDPVNMDFVVHGYVDGVHGHMLNDLDNLWYDALFGDTQYSWIDNTAHGYGAFWETQSYQVDYPPGVITIRNHALLYWGPGDPHEFGEWSMGNVHHEHTELLHHVVDDWDVIRDSLRDDFQDESFVDLVDLVDGGNAGPYQQIQHDGRKLRVWLNS